MRAVRVSCSASSLRSDLLTRRGVAGTDVLAGFGVIARAICRGVQTCPEDYASLETSCVSSAILSVPGNSKRPCSGLVGHDRRASVIDQTKKNRITDEINSTVRAELRSDSTTSVVDRKGLEYPLPEQADVVHLSALLVADEVVGLVGHQRSVEKRNEASAVEPALGELPRHQCCS